MELAILIGIILLSETFLKKKGIGISYKKVIYILLAVSLAVNLIISFAIFTLKNGKSSNLDGYFIIPLAISMCIAFALFSLKKTKYNSSTQKVGSDRKFKNILYSTTPIIFLIISKYSFLLPIYSPQVLNVESQSPFVAVSLYSIFTCITAILVWFTVKTKSLKFDISLTLTMLLYSIYLTTTYCLVLLYGLIPKYKISYPYYGSILCLSFLPILAVLVVIFLQSPHNNLRINENV